MNLPLRSLMAVGVTQVLAGIASAQQSALVTHLAGRPEMQAAMPVRAPTASILQSVGLSYLDGVLVGGGADYATRFDPKGAEFTPALPSAERLFPLTLRATGYGRGAAEQPVGPAQILRDGLTVHYQREGFVESYEHRVDGLKQSFTFTRLPGGGASHKGGDLVVSMQIDTDLQFAGRGSSGQNTADGGVRFLSGNMGVAIGAVIGIDANGARCTGSLDYTGDSLEMRLPASFVNQAALPLVLDPLVGTIFPVATGFADSELDIAYDATENVYLSTWRRRFSATSFGIRGQRISDTGSLVGGTLFLATLSSFSTPRVANIATEDAFLVVYAANGDIFGRSVLAATGAVSLQATIRDTADFLANPDVGGEAAADDEGIVVWQNVTTGAITAKQVNVDGDVLPPTVTPFAGVVEIGDVTGSWINFAPRISNSGGSTGNHCIVFTREFTGTPGSVVRGVLVNRNLVIRDDFINPSGLSNGDSDSPSVDGDGRNWVIAWENEATPGSGDNNVQARAVGYDPNAPALSQAFLASGIVNVEANLNDDERGASVAWMGGSALVMYEDQAVASGDYDVFAQPIDVFTCLDCGPRLTVDQAGGAQRRIVAASKATGGGSADNALIVWTERNLTTADDDGFARRYRADDGIHTNLGGGCGSGGAVFAGCAMTGNTGFRARLRSSLPSATTWLVISPSRLDFGCDGCTLVPDPFSGFILVANTDARGDASVAVGIPAGPALVGASFYQQWLIADTASPSCSVFGTDLSNAFETVIQ